MTAPAGPVAGSSDGADEGRSARRAMLEQLRRECGTEEEFDTARTRPIWTETVDTCSSSSALDGPSAAELERIRVENRKCFQRLVAENAPEWFTAVRARELGESSDFAVWKSPFFWDFAGRLEAGQRLGRGGQAEICEALNDRRVTQYVLKVFRSDCFLADLQRLWVCEAGRAHRVDSGRTLAGRTSCCCVINGTLLKDGRFAFVMRRYWGDLRKLLDLQSVKDVETHQNPPLPLSITVWILWQIAYGMAGLHYDGILHRDLKAANVLLDKDIVDYCSEGECIQSKPAFGSVGIADFETSEGVMGTVFWRAPEILLALKSKVRNVHLDASQSKPAFGSVGIADFETSEGVMGTAFWRAPEILHALKSKVKNIHLDASIWTKKVDVYSYAMTCYEVLTGCIPFQNRVPNDYDGVIEGERPPLPDYVDPEIQELVRRCWHSEPSMRPTFLEIRKDLEVILEKRAEVSMSIREDERDAEARRWLQLRAIW